MSNLIRTLLVKIIPPLLLIGLAVALIINFPLQSDSPRGAFSSDSGENTPIDAESGAPPRGYDSDSFAGSLTALLRDGYRVWDGVYDAERDRLGFADPLPGISSAPRVFLCEETGCPYLYPRMGYVFQSDDTGAQTLLSHDGTIIENDRNLTFAGVRGEGNAPLFLLDGEYFLYHEGTGRFIPAAYDPSPRQHGGLFDIPSYYGADDSANGIRIIHADGKYGYGTENGRTLVQPLYKAAYPYSEGVGCLVDFLDRLCFFNTNGEMLTGISQKYYAAKDASDGQVLGYYYFKNGLTLASSVPTARQNASANGGVLIKRTGGILPIPSDYQVYSYSDGRILLGKGGYYGYMDENGAWVTNPVYRIARPFYEGLAVVGGDDGKMGVIDRRGTVVIPLVFDGITDCSGGVTALLDSETGWRILNKLTPGETGGE